MLGTRNCAVGKNITYNVLRLGVCYFALQILQALDKIYRQNNSTKPLLVAGRIFKIKLIIKTR